jgi:hypothetical protein
MDNYQMGQRKELSDVGEQQVETGVSGTEGAFAIYIVRGVNGYSDDADIQRHQS